MYMPMLGLLGTHQHIFLNNIFWGISLIFVHTFPKQFSWSWNEFLSFLLCGGDNSRVLAVFGSAKSFHWGCRTVRTPEKAYCTTDGLTPLLLLALEWNRVLSINIVGFIFPYGQPLSRSFSQKTAIFLAFFYMGWREQHRGCGGREGGGARSAPFFALVSLNRQVDEARPKPTSPHVKGFAKVRILFIWTSKRIPYPCISPLPLYVLVLVLVLAYDVMVWFGCSGGNGAHCTESLVSAPHPLRSGLQKYQ